MALAYDDILFSCATPSEDVMRKALAARPHLPEHQADFIAYLSGYSHYPESVSVLNEFGLIFLKNRALFYDSQNLSLHLKIVINDLSHDIVSLSSSFLAKKFRSKILRNFIKAKGRNGDYINNNNEFIRECHLALKKIPKEEREEFLKAYWDQVENPLGEEEVSFSKEGSGQRVRRIVFHFAQFPARNTAENLKRFFNNVTAVIGVNDNDDAYNLSVKRLRGATDCHQSLAIAKWFICSGPQKLDSFPLTD